MDSVRVCDFGACDARDVIIDDYFIIPDVNGVDKCIYQFTAVLRIIYVAHGEAAEEQLHVGGGQLHLAAEFYLRYFGVNIVKSFFEGVHLGVYAIDQAL